MIEGQALQKAIDHIQVQQSNRRVWSEHDDAESVARMIQGEAGELVVAITESILSGDVFSVASEIADILYLTHRLCVELGLSPAQLIEMKTLRNSMKYNDAILNNGYDYTEATVLAKNGWKAMGGDEAFSHAYLDVLAEEP